MIKNVNISLDKETVGPKRENVLFVTKFTLTLFLCCSHLFIELHIHTSELQSVQPVFVLLLLLLMATLQPHCSTAR